ncbi:hypothetical protein C8J56DRAFT_1094128 [Mycena floridula]|nr:hypothetical protein C8J56DRAFT_1094128 [Mycena floridula]
MESARIALSQQDPFAKLFNPICHDQLLGRGIVTNCNGTNTGQQSATFNVHSVFAQLVNLRPPDSSATNASQEVDLQPRVFPAQHCCPDTPKASILRVHGNHRSSNGFLKTAPFKSAAGSQQSAWVDVVFRPLPQWHSFIGNAQCWKQSGLLVEAQALDIFQQPVKGQRFAANLSLEMNQGCSQTFKLGRFDGNHGKVKGLRATSSLQFARVAQTLMKFRRITFEATTVWRQPLAGNESRFPVNFHSAQCSLEPFEGQRITSERRTVSLQPFKSQSAQCSLEPFEDQRSTSFAATTQISKVGAQQRLQNQSGLLMHLGNLKGLAATEKSAVRFVGNLLLEMNRGCPRTFTALSVRWNLPKAKEWAKVAHILLKIDKFHRNHTNLEGWCTTASLKSVRVAHALRKLERSSGNQAKRDGPPATLGQKSIAVVESPLNVAPFRCNLSNLRALSVRWNLSKPKDRQVSPQPSKPQWFAGNSRITFESRTVSVQPSKSQSFVGNLVLKTVKVAHTQPKYLMFGATAQTSMTLHLDWFDGNQGKVKGSPPTPGRESVKVAHTPQSSAGLSATAQIPRPSTQAAECARMLRCNHKNVTGQSTTFSLHSDSSRSTKRPGDSSAKIDLQKLLSFASRPTKPKARPRSDMFSRDRMPTRMIFFQANQTRHSLGGLLELHEDHVLPVLRRALGVQRGWIETIHGLLAPAFTFDDTGHLPTVEVKFEPGTPDYSGYVVKVDFVACSYCGMSNTLTITPAVVSIYERHLPSWESYGQRLCNDPDIQATHTLNLIAFLFFTTSIEKLNMPRAMTQTRAHVKIYGSKKLIQAIQPLSQADYNNKVLKPLQRVVTFHLSKHMDGRKTLGQQKEKFDLAMKGIMASFKQHLINHLINNEETLNEVSAFALSKFQDIRKPFIAEAQLGAAEEDRLRLKRKASDDGHQPFNKASRTSSPASTNNRQQAVPKQVVSAVITRPKGTNSSRKWTVSQASTD